jgi:hypothetical protein
MIDDEHLIMTIAIRIQLYSDIHVNFVNIFIVETSRLFP